MACETADDKATRGLGEAETWPWWSTGRLMHVPQHNDSGVQEDAERTKYLRIAEKVTLSEVVLSQRN